MKIVPVRAEAGLLNRLLIGRQFARIWLSGAVSSVGDFVFDTTVLLWISTVLARGKPWAPAAASGVLIAVLVPTLVVGPLAGVFIDRWDPRRTMLTSDAIRAALVGSLAIIPLAPSGTLSVTLQLVAVYTVIVLNTIVSRFFIPARFTIIADIVLERDQSRASGITQATNAAAGMIGPPLAAPLLFTVGVEWALLLNASSFVFSFLMILKVGRTMAASGKKATEDSPSFWREFRTGLAAIVRTRVVRSMMLVGVIANIAAQVFNALGVFFVMVNLHTQAKFFGLQDMMSATGVVIGASIAGWLGARLGPARVIWSSLLLFGLLLGVYSRMSDFLIALAVLLLATIPLGAMNTAATPLLLRAVPREVLGRVFATFLPVIQSSGIAGVAIAGWLSSTLLRDLDVRVLDVHFGTYDTLLLACSVLIVIAGGYATVALKEQTAPRHWRRASSPAPPIRPQD